MPRRPNPDFQVDKGRWSRSSLRPCGQGTPVPAPAPAREASADAELVARCRAGDERAWAELVERFSRYVYAIATQGFRLSEADAEDVFQEAFARTYEHLDRLRDDAAIRPWLGQLTRRLCVDRLRQTARVGGP